MRIVDCHVHLNGEVSAADVVKAADANGVERVILISKPERVSTRQTRDNMLYASKLAAAARDRISALAWINPTLPGAAELAAEALESLGFVGIKIIPDHWYAYEERLEPFWERMNSLHASILFHTGILYGNDDGSRFCQPLYLEKLLHYPRIRFAMAHISWPWCEECLAVMGRMRAAANYDPKGWQSYVDLTPGTPKHIRKQAVANAIAFCGVERIMFGSDSTLPGTLTYQKQILGSDLQLFDSLRLTAAQKERILSGTADELFPAKR
ncbi:MAG: amidohydrolase family protein [Planctomycetota bacterium]|nr:amidohydrolase family protein [Planctomycetota bacterium]